MPRRKKVKEDDFTLTAVDPNTGDETSHTVKGVTDPKQALDRVKGKPEFSNPKGEVVVKPEQPGGGASPLSRPATSGARARSQTQGMGGLTESYDSTKFRYSYTIGLPNGFTDFMKKTKGRTKGLVVEQRDGRVYMTVESPDAGTPGPVGSASSSGIQPPVSERYPSTRTVALSRV